MLVGNSLFQAAFTTVTGADGMYPTHAPVESVVQNTEVAALQPEAVTSCAFVPPEKTNSPPPAGSGLLVLGGGGVLVPPEVYVNAFGSAAAEIESGLATVTVTLPVPVTAGVVTASCVEEMNVAGTEIPLIVTVAPLWNPVP